MTISFFVPGLARPKGSKSAFAVRKAGVYTGRVAVVDDVGPALKAWEHDIRVAAAAQMHGSALLEGPICLDLAFALPKPKALPKSRRLWPCGSRNDLDKLIRSVLDGLTNRVIQDDGQVVILSASKQYGDLPGVEVTIETIRSASEGVQRGGNSP